MRYNRPNSKDYAVIEGAADLSMAEIVSIRMGGDDGRKTALEVVKEAHFTNRKGEPVDIAANDGMGLSLKQWRWLTSTIWDAARDEDLDPEA